MANIIPRPIRDIVMGPSNIRSPIDRVNAAGPGSGEQSIASILGGGMFTLPPAKKMVMAIGRIALAMIGTIALYASRGSAPIAAALGAVVSSPAVAVGGGSWMLYHGVAAAIGSVASNSFATLGMGLAYATGGWIFLEFHDIIPFGLGEVFLDKGADAAAPSIVNMYIPSPQGGSTYG